MYFEAPFALPFDLHSVIVLIFTYCGTPARLMMLAVDRSISGVLLRQVAELLLCLGATLFGRPGPGTCGHEAWHPERQNFSRESMETCTVWTSMDIFAIWILKGSWEAIFRVTDKYNCETLHRIYVAMKGCARFDLYLVMGQGWCAMWLVPGT